MSSKIMMTTLNQVDNKLRACQDAGLFIGISAQHAIKIFNQVVCAQNHMNTSFIEKLTLELKKPRIMRKPATDVA